MQDEPISDEVAIALCEKLNKLELTPEERQLLNAILRIVWDVTAPDASPEKEFDPKLGGCFEPGQAEIIMAYQTEPTYESVTKSFESTSITRLRGRVRIHIIGAPPPPKP
jgi:hypothetical protein